MQQALQKTLLHGLRTAFIFIFVATWMYTALPSLFSFPPKVQKAEAAVNFVQGDSQLASAPTVSVTSSVTYAGDLLVVVADWNNSLSLTSISDTQGNLYATAIGPIIWGVPNSDRTQMFYAKNIKGGTNTVTVKISGTPIGLSLHVNEYSGADTVSPLDATSVGTNPNGAPSLDSGSVSTSSSNELIFGYGDFAGPTTPLVAGSGFVSRTINASGENLSEDKYVTSAGLYNATETGAGSPNPWIMMMATFKSNMSGYEASSRSDRLSDSRPSVTSNHTFSFTPNRAISGSSTLTFAFPSGFAATIDCGDIDAATSSPFNFNYPGCAPTATAWGAQVKAVISNVQFEAASHLDLTTVPVAFDSNNIAGDLIVVVVDWNNTSANVSSITDTNGNTYTSAVGPINWNGLAPTYRGQIFYAKNIKGGANTVTVTLSAAATSSFEVYIHEYSGADTVSPLDAVSSATSNSGTAMDSGSATTHVANELIFGAGFTNAVSAAGAGFTIRSTLDNNMTEDKSVTSTGSYKAVETGDGSAWIMMMATFKAAGSVLTLTAPLDSAVHVATSTPMSIYIGSNATTTQQGVHWITNPTTAGAYAITLGGTSGNSGNFLVAIGGGQTVSAQVAESLALTVSSVGASAFPATGILDNFNRADGSLGVGNWSCPLEAGHGGMSISSNAIVGASPGDCYWDASTFGPDSEAYVKITTKPESNGECDAVAARLSGAGTSSLSGYWAEFCVDAGTDTFTLYRFDAGTPTAISNGTQELSSGDSIGLEVVGSTVKMYYKIGAGAWTQKLSVTDGTYQSAGNIGVHAEGITTVLDDFGGGTVSRCIADDGATVNTVTTTASSVPFGTVSANTFYQGCQDLIVSTNAANGYSLTGQENHAMMAPGGQTIPDTTCDGGQCSSASSGAWVNASKNGFGHTCTDQLGHDCSGVYSEGTKFRPFANVAGGTTSPISFISSWALADNTCSGSSCSLTVSPQQGDTLLVGIEYRSDLANLNSVSDNKSETYAQIFSDTNLGTHYGNTLYCLAGIASGVTSVTVQYSASNFSTMLVAEYSGVGCTVDTLSAPTNHQQGGGTPHGWWTSNAITPIAGQSELIFSLNEDNSGAAPVTFTATAAGFSAVRTSGFSTNDDAYVFASHRIVASTSGSYTSSGASDSATDSGGNDPWIVAFKATPVFGEIIMASSTPSVATGRVKYRLSRSPGQAAGTYTNIVDYILTGTF